MPNSGQYVAKNGAKMTLLFHFWSYLFYTIFESFLKKIFIFIEKSIFTLYDTCIVVFIASIICENYRFFSNSVYATKHFP